MNDDCVMSLGEYVRNNRSLEGIYIGNNKITDKGIEILSRYLAGNITLKEVGISGNRKITDASITYLIKMIETSHIENIAFSWTGISKKNVLIVPLAANLLKNGSKKLDFFEK